MRFTLYYDGPLPSAAGEGRLKEKHDIREKLHWQILQLFRDHPALPIPVNGQDWANWPEWKWPQLVLKLSSAEKLAGGEVSPVSQGWFEKDVVTEIGPFHFVPLVRGNLDLICELDVLFLRQGQPE